MAKQKKEEKKEPKETVHRFFPIDIFHNESIDRWVVVMGCATCGTQHIFYPRR